MIKAIMAVDDKGGVSKNGTMPWPKNSNDLKWFKKHTLNHVVIMGRKTWIDPFMKPPLPNRINILATRKEKNNFPGADEYINKDLIENVEILIKKYNNLDIFVIGGPNILNQLFTLIETFYLTRIYGNFSCDNNINLSKIENEMKLEEKIDGDSTCHFEIWKR
tara:strand:- start:2518 stop:3006 length:489 start_codon:yes stop_codon:yes gene_type:complete